MMRPPLSPAEGYGNRTISAAVFPEKLHGHLTLPAVGSGYFYEDATSI